MKNMNDILKRICVFDWTLILGIFNSLIWIAIMSIIGSYNPYGGVLFLVLLVFSTTMTLICCYLRIIKKHKNTLNIILNAVPLIIIFITLMLY